MKFRKNRQIAKLKADTEALAIPEGRRVGQAGHAKALHYLKVRLEGMELLPFAGEKLELTYEAKHPSDGFKQLYTNLVGVIPGRDRTLEPILIGAHYDSVIDAPCADDNATSIAMTLAIAEEFISKDLERDLIIALFDAEEPPHFMSDAMGSTRFYKDHCQEIQFAGVIISDLIGHDLDLKDLGVNFPGKGLLQARAGKTVFVLGAESDPAFPGIVEKVATKSRGLNIFPTMNDYVGSLSDHHAFECAGQPFLFLSCGQGKYYHDKRDDLRWINFEKLFKITHFVSDLISELDRKDADASCSEQELVDFEIRMIRRITGRVLPLVMSKFGIAMPKTRADMNQMIGGLITGMG